MKSIFVGPNGLRAGFRFLVFAGLVVVLNRMLIDGTVRFVIHGLGIALTGELDPVSEGLSNAVLLLAAIAATLMMGRVERRSWSDYGVPASGLMGRKFWAGAAFGLGAVSLLVGLIALAHGYSPGVLNFKGSEMLLYAALWIMASLLAGFAEEILIRGYPQSTLASGMGFWPAATLLSVASGALRVLNKPMGWIDGAGATLLALFACLSLRRTGDLRFAIGFRAAFNLAALYLYSAPRGGQLAKGRMLDATFHGPAAITGGPLGPQAGLLVFPVLALAYLGLDVVYPREQQRMRRLEPDAVFDIARHE